jgi:hypothetical protein
MCLFFASTGEVSKMNPWCNKTSNIRVTYYCGSVFELHVIVNNTQILRVAQKCFYGEFIPPATIKRSRIFMCKAWYFYPILTKFGVSRQIFVKFLNIIFSGIVQWGPRWYMRRNGRTDGQTGRREDITKSVGHFRDCTNARKKSATSVTCLYSLKHLNWFC